MDPPHRSPPVRHHRGYHIGSLIHLPHATVVCSVTNTPDLPGLVSPCGHAGLGVLELFHGEVSCLAAKGLPMFPVVPNDHSSSIQSTCTSISQVVNDVVPSVSSPPDEACIEPNDDQILTLHPAPPPSYPVTFFLFFLLFGLSSLIPQACLPDPGVGSYGRTREVGGKQGKAEEVGFFSSFCRKMIVRPCGMWCWIRARSRSSCTWSCADGTCAVVHG